MQSMINYVQDQGGHQSSGKPSRGHGKWKGGGASARKNQSSYMNVSSETLWSDIQEFAILKYQVLIVNKSLHRKLGISSGLNTLVMK